MRVKGKSAALQTAKFGQDMRPVLILGRQGRRPVVVFCGPVPAQKCYDREKDSRWVSNVYYSAWINYTWTMTYT